MPSLSRTTPLLSRRTLLCGGSVLLGAGLSGCLGSNPFGCDSMHSAVVRAKRVELSAAERDAIDPITFGELPDAEQEFVRTAVEEGEYRKCPAADPYIPEPLTSFADRVERRSAETDAGAVYLQYEETYYALGVTIEDQSSATLPE